MIFSYKGREWRGVRVFVYFNLHSGQWSLRATEGPDKGRVVAHANRLHLWFASPQVSIAGRDRVRRERVKNVHAGLVGYAEGFDYVPDEYQCTGTVTYNPFRDDGFIYREDGQPFYHAQLCRMYENRAVIAYSL